MTKTSEWRGDRKRMKGNEDGTVHSFWTFPSFLISRRRRITEGFGVRLNDLGSSTWTCHGIEGIINQSGVNFAFSIPRKSDNYCKSFAKMVHVQRFLTFRDSQKESEQNVPFFLKMMNDWDKIFFTPYILSSSPSIHHHKEWSSFALFLVLMKETVHLSPIQSFDPEQCSLEVSDKGFASRIDVCQRISILPSLNFCSCLENFSWEEEKFFLAFLRPIWTLRQVKVKWMNVKRRRRWRGRNIDVNEGEKETRRIDSKTDPFFGTFTSRPKNKVVRRRK